MKRWLWVAALLFAWALLMGAGSCSWPPVPPTPTPSPTATPEPPPTPTPEPEPSPVCPPVGATCGCWHRPPGEGWQQLPPCPPPTPEPPPTPGCVLSGQPGPLLAGHVPELGIEVNLAMRRLKLDCEVGGRCVLEEGRQEWQAKVCVALREAGLCCGQHEAGTDEIAVAYGPTTAWEGWHIYAGEASGPGTVVWSPQAARPAYAAPTAPTPEPSQNCPSPRPDRSPDHLRIALICAGSWCDATPQTVGTQEYCEAIGMSPMLDGTVRRSCPMRSECPGFQCELRVPCELYAMAGAYAWETFPTWKPVVRNPDNPAQASCDGCDRIRVCSSDRTVCSDWVAP